MTPCYPVYIKPFLYARILFENIRRMEWLSSFGIYPRRSFRPIFNFWRIIIIISFYCSKVCWKSNCCLFLKLISFFPSFLLISLENLKSSSDWAFRFNYRSYYWTSDWRNTNKSKSEILKKLFWTRKRMDFTLQSIKKMKS